MKIYLVFIAVGTFLFSDVRSDTTFGIGVGSLYNGLGLNFGRTTDTNLSYGAIGCLGWSTSSSETSVGSEGNGQSSGGSRNANCGVSFGFVTTNLLSRRNHGLGINLGVSHDSGSDQIAGTEVHVTPSYHYFFSGIGRRGFNLGFGPRITFREKSNDTGLILNFGFQF